LKFDVHQLLKDKKQDLQILMPDCEVSGHRAAYVKGLNSFFIPKLVVKGFELKTIALSFENSYKNGAIKGVIHLDIGGEITEANFGGLGGLKDWGVKKGGNSILKYLNDKRTFERKSLQDKWLLDKKNPPKSILSSAQGMFGLEEMGLNALLPTVPIKYTKAKMPWYKRFNPFVKGDPIPVAPDQSPLAN